MKRKNLLFKSLLVAAGLFVGASAWADATVIFERGTTTTWSNADLTDWPCDYATPTINGGLNVASNNGGWACTKSISVTANSIVTLTATLHTGGASGRPGSYDYVQIGGVSARFNEQDKVASVDIDGTSTNLSLTYNRTSDYDIEITIDQATGAVSYTIGGKSGTSTSTTSITNVVFGHYKAGRENYGINPILKKISVSEVKQTVTTADYTVKFVNGSGTDVKESETRKGSVGASVLLSAADIADFKTYDVDNNVTGKYIYVSDNASSSSIASDGSTVVTVTFREAATYSYSVKTSLGETITAGSDFEGESISYYFPHYQLSGTDLYVKAKNSTNPWYGNTFTLTSNNQEETVTYTDANVANVVYLIEAEDLLTTTANVNANVHIRCSGGKGGYSSENVEATTLAPGKYKITGAVWGNGTETLKVVDANDNVYYSLDTNGNWTETTSDEFTLSASTTLYVVGGNSSKCLDYIYIQKTSGDVVEFTLGDDVSYKSYIPTKAVDFTTLEGVKAYVVTDYDDGMMTLTAVDAVPAGTPVLLKGTKGNSVEMVAATGTVAAPETNYLKATPSDGINMTDDDSNKYVLSFHNGDWSFCHFNGTLPAGKVYVELPVSAGARPANVGIRFAGEETTGIADVQRSAVAQTYYNLNGQQVAQPSKGLYIVNGKKVIKK